MATLTLTPAQYSGPLALLVEDEPKSLRLRRMLLKQHGFVILAVQTVKDALREFVAAPGVDLVITDIRLNPKIPQDKSGVELAEHLRRIAQDLPIVGYSAAFAENDLTQSERDLFTSYYPRGSSGATEIAKYIESWRGMAEEFHVRRLNEATLRLATYRRKYVLSEPDYATLRFLVPHRLIQTEGSIASIEEVLNQAGFELRMVERGYSRPTLDDQSAHVTSPIPVWLRTEKDASIAEVYGFPELYSFAETKDEALKTLLLLMDGFYQDLRGASDLSDRLKAVASFLEGVFQ
jgi:CheY-like chemotaxis protein